MNFRIESQIDHSCPSMRWIVTIRQDGEITHRFKKYGGMKVHDQMIRDAVKWVGSIHGHPVGHYWSEVFPDSSPSGTWEKRSIRLLYDDPAD